MLSEIKKSAENLIVLKRVEKELTGLKAEHDERFMEVIADETDYLLDELYEVQIERDVTSKRLSDEMDELTEAYDVVNEYICLVDDPEYGSGLKLADEIKSILSKHGITEIGAEVVWDARKVKEKEFSDWGEQFDARFMEALDQYIERNDYEILPTLAEDIERIISEVIAEQSKGGAE